MLILPCAVLSLMLSLAACKTATAPGPVPRTAPAAGPVAPSNNQVSEVTGVEQGGADDVAPTAAERVTLELYVMSRCPFAAPVLQTVYALHRSMGSALDVRLDYIVTEDERGQLQALHGEQELRGNILQLCALHHFGASRGLRFVSCVSRTYPQIPNNWEACATETGLDAETLMGCYTSPAGEQLLRASMARAKAAGAQGSPTIVVGGQAYQGARDQASLLRELCPRYTRTAPGACASMPREVPVKLLVLNDRRCPTCVTDNLERNLRQRFSRALEVRVVDYATEEGRRLYRELKLTGLPALLFDAQVEQHEQHATLARWMERRGAYHLLKMPTTFDPTAEICDNKMDDTGNGKVDCADATCRDQRICRRDRPRRLEVFIMSQCPFAAQGLLAMKEVQKSFGGQLAFDVHYIAERTRDGFSSLHGQTEVDEDLRQLCAKTLYGRNNRYLDYVWCRMNDYRSDTWQGCATGGISAQRIERCATSAQGRKLLKQDLQQARSLQISGSPTWLVNNRHTFNGISAEQIRQGVCEHNARLKSCEKTLSDTPPGTTGGSCQ